MQPPAETVLAWRHRAAAVQVLALSLGQVRTRMAHSALRAFRRACASRASLELRGSVVQPLLMRKAKAFALRMAALVRRTHAIFKLQAMHTWRHCCLKEIVVGSQVRMLKDISDLREEAVRRRSEVAQSQLIEVVDDSNNQLRLELRYRQGIHRCVATVARAFQRQLHAVLAQMRLCRVAS